MRKATFALLSLAAFLIYLTAPRWTAHAAFPGTNGRVSLIQIDPNTGNITGLFASNSDGSSMIQLTNLPAEVSDWSPDGSQVAFDFYDGFNSQIGLVDAKGTLVTQLTTDESVFHGEPAWSPDGKKIAIESDNGNFPSEEGIYLIDSSTGAFLLRLTANPYGQPDMDPRWSPDGNWIVFTRVKQAAPGPKHNRNYPSVAASFLVHPDGTGLRQLTDWGLNATATDWSPDGSKIALYSHSLNKPPSSIYTIHPDGSGLTVLVRSFGKPGASGVGAARFSPDGTQLIFVGGPGGPMVSPPVGLWFVNADGSGLTENTAFGVAGLPQLPAWGTHPLQ